MDNRVKRVIEREEDKKRINNELKERYRRVLKRTILNFDCKGPESQRVVYENENMIDLVQDELDSRVKLMDAIGKELQSKVQHTRNKLETYQTDQIQQRVELLNQKIRILEATIRHITQED